MSDNIILLSSDDEFETPVQPAKKLKTGIDVSVLKKLNNLREITAACYDVQTPPYTYKRTFHSNDETEAKLTIIIEGDKVESKENSDKNNVINLIDDFFEENTISEPKKEIANSDCMILESDSESEGEDLNYPNLATETTENEPIKTETTTCSPTPEPQPQEDNNLETNILNRPSTSTASESQKLLDELLETCSKSLQNSKYECKVVPKFSTLKENFEKCKSIHEEPNFKKMLRESAITAKISAPEAVITFQRLYSYLLDHINGEAVEVDMDSLTKLKKLEKACKRLLHKLRVLEEAELNFDDDDDSTYIQIDRLSQRLTKVYGAYCKLLKKSPYAGRLLHDKVQCGFSAHGEINRALTKLYRDCRTLPSYYDIEKAVRRCVSKNDLSLGESEIKEESSNCFTKMGNLLQMRRKKELYEVHCGVITLSEDPATVDDGLKAKLEENQQEGDRKMREVVQKFVQMQESSVNVEVSEDSDDSNFKESDSE